MRRTHEDGLSKLQPTKTVSITFSCPVLPESVDLNSWRFEVRQYVPPVKQCLRCLRYGHIAKFCKNSERCSICGEAHNYTNCRTSSKDAKCCHCNGNHIAISSTCPIKIENIRSHKEKFEKKRTYADVSKQNNSTNFPSLNKTDQFISLLNSETILHILSESFVKLLTLNKKNEKPVCTESIKNVLQETFKNHANSSSKKQ